MAELIYKGMLKNCYAGDFRMDGKTPCTATYASIRKMIDIQPTTTESEIRAKAIDEFAEKLNKKITDFVLEHQSQLTFVSGVSMGWKFVDEIAEQLKGE